MGHGRHRGHDDRGDHRDHDGLEMRADAHGLLPLSML
jgi:hypothetical protein